MPVLVSSPWVARTNTNHGLYYHYFPFFSNRSLNPSPTRFSPSTVSMIARPGNVVKWGATRRNCLPSFSMEPHEGVGGCAPSPRKLRLPSAIIAAATPKVA